MHRIMDNIEGMQQHASPKCDIGKDHLPKEEIAERAKMYG
jgi:hypothetical protein